MQHFLLYYKWWVLKTAWLLGVELVGHSNLEWGYSRVLCAITCNVLL